MTDDAKKEAANKNDHLLRSEKGESAHPTDPSDGSETGYRKNDYRGTIILCCIVALIAAPVHSGFMLLLLTPVFAIWIPYSLIVIAFKPERRRIQGRKILIWATVFASIVSLHWYYAYTARREADEIVAAIKNFSAKNNRCPTSLDEIGIARAQLTKKLGYSGYFCEADGKPIFFYAATFIVFDTYHYDFSTNSWVYRAD